MEKHYIYKLTSPSGKVYIGRTVDFEARMHSHLSSANRGEKRPIYDAIRKHGWNNFIKEIVAEVIGDQVAYETELFYIILFDSIKNGYNLSIETSHGGDNWKNRKGTQEYRDYVVRMKDLNNRPIRMHGKKHSDSAKAKQKAAAAGRYSLDWFIQRHGSEEGIKKYEERRTWLKSRNLKKDSEGRFIKG